MSADVMREDIYSSSAAPTDSLNFEDNTLASGPMPYLTQQYALPIHKANADVTHNGGFRTDDGDRTPRPENTLRRKTPNGTLNSGYQSSTKDAIPHKHQILPLSEGNSVRYVPSAVPAVKRTFLQHQQQRAQNTSPAVWNAIHGMGWSSAAMSMSQPTFPLDSMLHQMPTHPYNAQQFYSQTVPSVLQPSMQYLGPTASGSQGQGLYGPYWHDGTFIPYRPAAVRDPRFYHHHYQATHWTGTLPTSQLIPNATLWPHSALPQPQWNQYGTIHPWVGGSHPVSHNLLAAQQMANHGTPLPLPQNHQIQSKVRNFDNLPELFQDEVNVRQNLGDKLMSVQPNVSDEFSPSSDNSRQRDKMFAWALQQYRELLNFIHTTRRQQQQARHAQGQAHVAPRPSIYPRPPKPSQNRSSLHLTRRRSEKDAVTKVNDLTPSRLRHTPDTSIASVEDSSQKINRELETTKTGPASVWSPSGVQFHDNEYSRRASHDQFSRPQQQLLPPHQSQFNDDHSIRRASSSSITSILPPLPNDNSPPSRAQAALHHITRLCQETDWQWVDGMHLGGCLAYGLGLYPKALRFYTKVLEIEPKHLEAISNLAAAFLALGRRTEAEQHWNRVVKAAPNHFEAVEHLIGMLCTDQRSRDAVRVIEYVERSLRLSKGSDSIKPAEAQSCASSTTSKSPATSDFSDKIAYDFDADGESVSADCRDAPGTNEPGFGSSGFAIPGSENGRILALIHAKGNMLYGLGDNAGASKAFEDAVLIAVGRMFNDIQGLVKHILNVVTASIRQHQSPQQRHQSHRNGVKSNDPILLSPEQALTTARLCFPLHGELPGLQHLSGNVHTLARKAVISTTSNSLLSLAKIFQDSMSNSSRSAGITPLPSGVRDILALYYLSFSLQQSPSTANNVGILLASVQQKTAVAVNATQKPEIPGVVPGSGVALALQYYNFGLSLDQHHAHLYTNLGSLLKDIGQLDAAINMYERAVKCDAKFDIALANLANAVKDKGRINEAISYYRRAVDASPDFAEAVCGLANALNSVCSWTGRGGIAADGGKRDRWHVDASGMLLDARQADVRNSGWIKRVIEIVEKQLVDGENWGSGVLSAAVVDELLRQIDIACEPVSQGKGNKAVSLRDSVKLWAGQKWEGARVVRLVERATKRLTWRLYRDIYVEKRSEASSAPSYDRPQLPASLTTPSAPTVLPFHTFTCPMSAKQIRLISQRNGLRISVSTLRAPWLPKQVFSPPAPPAPFLRVGYVSSDFNNHPLAHLMQSVFGLHDTKRVKAFCYATTASDNSSHRQQIEAEAPSFVDASGWSTGKLVDQILQDGIHILVNLNGYTRGARNEVFAARPAPIQMSFMGFAGTLGAEWCDYLLADEIAIPPETLRPCRKNVDLHDQMADENHGGDGNDDWVYGENIIYCRDTFFCCDHRQSAPDATGSSKQQQISWTDERARRWAMRRELFPHISDDTIIFGNFNQLYKIEPTTFRTWLRILSRVPNSILWLLRFPDTGQAHLQATAKLWAGEAVASRVHFTDVAPKHLHISRARVCDLVLDTAECNAHTTAADVLWSGTPLLTLPRYPYKMCSRMAASILRGALPKSEAGDFAATELIARDEDDYEEKAVALGNGLRYAKKGCEGVGDGRLMELRRLLFESRWSSPLFDTRRWVADLEDGYEEAWSRWVEGEGGDIWLNRLPRGGGRGVDGKLKEES